MPHGVCVKPQRRTASALSSDERSSDRLSRSGRSPYARRTTLAPQYIAGVPPVGVVAPAHAEATACNADASLCGAAAGAAKPKTIAVRAWAIPITRSWNRFLFVLEPAPSFAIFTNAVDGGAFKCRKPESNRANPGFQAKKGHQDPFQAHVRARPGARSSHCVSSATPAGTRWDTAST